MPLFKKSASDSGVLSERYLKALQKCRMLLLKVTFLNDCPCSLVYINRMPPVTDQSFFESLC